MIKECSKCGAKYKIIEQDYPMRDKDIIQCDFCQNIIHRWNGGVICSSELVSKPTNVIYLDEENK